jgi:hypothetical protein
MFKDKTFCPSLLTAVCLFCVSLGGNLLLAQNVLAQASKTTGQSLSPNANATDNSVTGGAKDALPAKVDAKGKAQKSLDTYLDAQLAREKNKHRQYFEGLAKNVSETGRYQAERLRAQAAAKPMQKYTPDDNAYQPMSARVPGYTPTGAGLPARAPVYVSQDLEYAKMKEQMAEEKAAQLRKVEAEKEAALEQSMANMKSQMKSSHVPGAAVAKPEGSNLFVRYYGPSDSSKPYEVHPAAARIVPHQ